MPRQRKAMMYNQPMRRAAISFLLCFTASLSAGEWTDRARFSGTLRDFYMYRSLGPDGQETMAAGGRLAYTTPKKHGLSANAALYGAQGLIFVDPDRDGAGLLAPRQRAYAALGEASARAETDNLYAQVFRQTIDTPFINRWDIRITPVSVEAYAAGAKKGAWNFMAAQVQRLKPRNSEQFLYMSEAAGLGHKKSVVMGGVEYKQDAGNYLQVWNYFCQDYVNILYLQYDRKLFSSGSWDFLLSVQGVDQRDTGDAIGGTLRGRMAGALATAKRKGFSFSLGYTATDNSTDIANPWSGYPGFTSIMEEDCDQKGERAWVTSLKYEFTALGAPGLEFTFYHTEAEVPPIGGLTTPDQRENNFILVYNFQDRLDGLSAAFKNAYVRNSASTGGVNYDDFRFILGWKF